MGAITIQQLHRTKVFTESQLANRWGIEKAMPFVPTLREDVAPCTEGIRILPIAKLHRECKCTS